MDNMLVSIADASTLLSIGRSTLYRLIGQGKLATVKIGRRTLIRVSSLHALTDGNDSS
ncbi:helix-turn-helix domain-containing protein [Sphingomonas sp.]|uniref:helix-turn-helix domain-containing protein n=1 Tax=Sphingomonas sp. TaxID=28214 RepID=UPI0025CD1B03|nr:helix-turn-helix domain-containing protein [Sphingomonas sp.]